MKALFLAGGMGTRLKPLTDHLPKPMVPIMDKPLLERNILKLKSGGIGLEEVVISTCYKPQAIENYFGNGTRHGVKISYVWEQTPLGTGGAIKHTEKFFDSSFLIFNSDILCDIDYAAMLAYHKQKQAAVTIAVTEVENPSLYGVIEYDDEGYVLSFKEKPQPQEITSNYINAGTYLFEPEVLKEIPSGRPVSVEREVFPQLLAKNYKIAVYKLRSYWMDIGTPQKYLQAHRDIMNGKYVISEIDFRRQSVYHGTNCSIHPTAKLVGPVYIGDHVKIGAYATIGPHAVIGSHTQIEANSSVKDSVLWANVTIGHGAQLDGTIVATGCHIPANSKYTATVYTEENRLKLAI